ncbi:TniQ family protein [Dongia sp.]|uniref:TniQ family protein n=1 Tax=Dongia sp. TaxID=1977262 RepID=UPI0035B4B263
MTVKQYPIRPQAYEGESILGYLKRTAKILGSENVGNLIPDFRAADRIWRLPFAWSLDQLADALGDQWEVLQNGLLGADTPRLAHFRGQVILRDWVRTSKMWICPECLVDSPFHRHNWYLGPLSACHVHRRTLINSCPSCPDHEFLWSLSGIEACPRCQMPFTLMQGRSVDQRTQDAMKVIHVIATGGTHPPGSVLSDLSMGDQLELLLSLGRVVAAVEGKAMRPGESKTTVSQSNLIARGVALLDDWPTKFTQYLELLMEKNAGEAKDSIMRLNPVQTLIGMQPDDGWRQIINDVFREFLPPKKIKRPPSGPRKHAPKSWFV